MKWGTRLANARRRAGLSQKKLAELAGVPQSTVGRIEAGLIDPRAETLDRLLRACGDMLDVLPLAGVGEDRTLVVERLRRTPRELVEDNVAMAAFVDKLRASGPSK